MTTTKTTVREYDDEGRMVKETVTEVGDVQVLRSRLYCNCSGAGTYCPVHGYPPVAPWRPAWTVSGQINTVTARDGHTITLTAYDRQIKTVNSGVN